MRASWWMCSEPSAPSGEAIRRSCPRLLSGVKWVSSYDGVMFSVCGKIQICRKCTGSVAEWLNSLWLTPLPALMRCTSP
ncbi:hypothetical protein D3C72_2459940 [compost metagenome]